MHYCHLSHSVRDASLQLPYRNYREGMQEKKNAQGWLWRWASGISPTGSEHKKRAEKQDKKNFYLLSSSPIIRTRYLKNVNGGTICLFAAHVTQSMTEQEVSQIRSTQLEEKKKKCYFQITQMIKGKNLKGYVVSLHSVWHWLRARGYFTRVKKRKQQ